MNAQTCVLAELSQTIQTFPRSTALEPPFVAGRVSVRLKFFAV